MDVEVDYYGFDTREYDDEDLQAMEDLFPEADCDHQPTKKPDSDSAQGHGHHHDFPFHSKDAFILDEDFDYEYWFPEEMLPEIYHHPSRNLYSATAHQDFAPPPDPYDIYFGDWRDWEVFIHWTNGSDYHTQASENSDSVIGQLHCSYDDYYPFSESWNLVYSQPSCINHPTTCDYGAAQLDNLDYGADQLHPPYDAGILDEHNCDHHYHHENQGFDL